MTKREIKDELKEVKYYYLHKKQFDTYESELGQPKAYELAKKYKVAIMQAPARLVDLYIELYIKNNTYESLADSWSYSFQHIARRNNELLEYLTKYFSNPNKVKEKKDVS